jgi:hypothetical protein
MTDSDGSLSGSASPARGPRGGAGLSLFDIVLLTAYSTLLFGGSPELLWRAPVGASHVGRFVVSYLAVIPFVAAYLYVRMRRISLGDLLGNVLIIWSIKMLITVGLYHVFVQGTAAELEPVQTVTQWHVKARVPYEPIAGFEGTRLRGRVRFGETDGLRTPVLLVLEGVTRGAPAPTARVPVRLHIAETGLEPTLAVAGLGAEMLVHNDTAATVVLTATQGHRSVFNVPVVPGQADASAKLKRPGLLELAPRTGRSDLHAWMYVAEHPYFAWSDTSGTFEMKRVPGGEYELVAFTIGAGTGGIVETRIAVTLPASEKVVLTIP